MKRFLAILLSIAMLCTVVPFGALVSADSENLIVNGDFETGDNTGWDVSNNSIKAEAAKDGNYGLLASGGAYAGGSVFVDVEPNTTYIFSIDVKSPAGDNAMMYIKRLDADRDEVTGQENPGIPVSGTEWTTFTKEIDTGDAVILQLQLCCGWDGTDKYFDNASLVKKEIVVEPSFDGVLYNGDFETGDLTKWEVDCADVFVTDEDAYAGDYSLVLGCDDAWAATLKQKNIKVEKNTDYVLSYYAIGVDGEPTTEEADFKVEFRSTSGDTVLKFADATLKDGLGCKLTDEWTKYEAVFNTGDADDIYLKLFAFGTGNVLLIDDIKIEKKASEPEEPATDNLIVNGDFTDGKDGWTIDGWCAANVAIVDNGGDAAVSLTGGYTNVKQTVALEANTDYVLSFYYIGKPIVYFKAVGQPGAWPDAGAEATLYTYEFNSGDVTSAELEIGCAEGTTYVDKVSLTKKASEPEIPDEPEEPAEPSFDGFIYNGDFEVDGNWGMNGKATIKDGVGKDGTRGVELYGDSTWGNSFSQKVTVKANTNYAISFDYKGATAGMFVKGIPNKFEEWPNSADWKTFKYSFKTGDDTVITIEFNGTEQTGVKYIDNIVLVEVPDPSFDGYITNGDFETGDATGGWTGSNLVISEEAAKDGKYGAVVSGNTYAALVLKGVAIEANTDYILTFDHKNPAGAQAAVYLKKVVEGNESNDGQKGYYPECGADEWATATIEFNSGDWTSLYIQICIGTESSTRFVDNVKLQKKASEPEEPEEPAEPSFDGFITNGGFETGDLTGWKSDDWCAANAAVTDAEKYEGDYSVSLTGGYTNVKQTVTLEANTDYVLTAYYKGKPIVYFKAVGNNGAWPDAGADWTLYTYEFNSGDVTSAELEIASADGTAYFDNVKIEKKASEPEIPDEPEVDNLIPNGDFETGDLTGWKSDRGSVVAGAGKDGSFGLYAEGGSAYRGANTYFAVEPYTTYIISMDVKSPDGSNALLFFKPADEDGNPGSAQISKDAVVQGADWTHVEFEYATAEEATVYIQLCTGWGETEKYFDNVKAVEKVEEPEEPIGELVLNGGFEKGDLSNWSGHCADVFVTNEESYSGDYAAVLGCADIWSNTLVQEGIAVKKNTDYILTFYAIGVDGELTDAEADFKIEFRGTSDSAVIKTAEGKDGAGFSLTDEWTKYEFKFNTGKYDNIWLKLFSFGTGNVLLIDDIVLVEYVPEPSFDGYITNGDFEMGDLTGGWYGAGFVSKDAAKDGEYGVEATVGSGAWAEYGGLENMIEVEPNTEYVLTFDHLSPTGHQAAVFIKGVEGTSTKEDLASAWPECEANTWLTSKIRFNSGKYDKIYIQLCVFEAGGTRYYDNVSLAVYVPEPGEKENPYPVSNPMMAPTYIDIPANGSVYYQFNMNFFDGFTIAASGVTAIEVDGVKYTDKNEFDEIVAKLKATSLQSGLVGFFNETDEVTTLIADYSEPFGTMNNPFELDEGANKVNTEGAFEYFAAFLPDFNGELTIKANVGDGFTVVINNAGEIIEPVVADGKINVTITVESYNAVMFIIGTTGAATELDIELAGPAIGSETRPIWVFEPEEIAEIDLSNGAVYYLFDLLFDGTELFVTGDESAYVVVNGTRYEYDAAAGAVVAVLEDNDSDTLKVEIGSNSSSALAGEVKFPEGNMYNPQVIVDGDVAIKFPAGDRWYAVYTALGDGTLTLTPAAAQFADIQVNVEGTENWAYLFTDQLNDSVSIEVKAGDKVIIEFYGGYDEDDNAIDVDTTVKVEGPVAPLNGWVLEDGKWAFYVDDAKVVDTWMKDSKGWCYLGADGYWVTNAWVRDSVTWCYIGADGYCVTDKWVKDSIGWVYLGSDGRMVTNAWVRDSVGWCFVGADGYCVTNKWVKDSTGWCYIGADGRMMTNAWVRDSKGWCYLDANGYCLVDTTATINGVKYTFDKNGNMI